MRFFNLIFILFVLIAIAGCKKSDPGDCFKSTGGIIEESREMGTYSYVMLKDNINLFFSNSSSNNITISAGKNLMSKIKTELIGDTLVISNENSCNWVRNFDTPIDVHLSSTNLAAIEYRSIGDINCADTIVCDSLCLDVFEGAGDIDLICNAYLIKSNLHYGTADIKMSGNCIISYVYSSSFGLIDNRALLANQVYVNNRSSNDVYLNAISTLGATIESIGNIYYVGNPSNLSLNQIGSGQLIKIEE